MIELRMEVVKVRNLFGKRFIVVQKSKTDKRIVTARRWKKDFTLSQARKVYKKNNTLRENVERFTLSNVEEFTVYGSDAKKSSDLITKENAQKEFGDIVSDTNVLRPGNISSRTAMRGQYVVSFILKNGAVVSARSNQYDTPIPVDQAREEALRRALGRLAYEVQGFSDVDEALFLFKNNTIKMREGIIYYKARIK